MAHSWEADIKYMHEHPELFYADMTCGYYDCKEQLHDIVQTIADANEDTYENTLAAVEKVFGGTLDESDSFYDYLHRVQRWYPHVLEVIEETKRKRDAK